MGIESEMSQLIKLQLKKPKSWNWELTTSKSSPHISLPTIQLFNSKGKLLVEAKDSAKRNSWNSSDFHTNKKINCEPTQYLQRCQSDILQRNLKNSVVKKTENVIINENRATKRNSNHLRKSRSEVVGSKNNDVKPNTFLNCFQRHASLKTDCKEEEMKERISKGIEQLGAVAANHKRTKSDDLFQRKLKYNEASMKRAITDGYMNFMTPRFKSFNCSDDVDFARKRAFDGDCDNSRENNNYRLRTCSAGTLIIAEESLNNIQRRRRRRATDDNIPFKLDDESAKLVNGSTGKHLRQTSDPIGKKLKTGIRTKKIIKQETNSERIIDRNGGGGDFACEEVADNCDKYDGNSNYIVQEPSSEAKSRKNSEPIVEKAKLKRRKKVRRHRSNESNSSSNEKRMCKKKEKDVKGRVIEKVTKEESNGDAALLQLVRRLSAENVKMGASVSRHSSKGLNGRRSQSSGSICNGKERHNSDTKICGSLPSYLDDRPNNGCNNNCEKPPLYDIQRIPPIGDGAPLHWKFSDTQAVLCDQGYGSERSPEEEYPPSLPGQEPCHHHLEPHTCYPFITPENTFKVTLMKGSRGLGLSVTGGTDSGGSWPGLIRIKRLFPHQPAATCGLLNIGDLLLDVNGITLIGLSNYEALEVLRTSPNQIEVRVCRPPPDVLSCVSPISEIPPPPPRRDPPTSLHLPPEILPTPEDDHYHGEFYITLTKIHGSLGFTLRKEDDSALGHYVRALVREPALTDGRIKAGDKIIAVNDVEISSMTHEEAVQFLRQCGDVVRLRLYRDSAQTPVAALSPSETTPRTSFSRKAHLRQEAVDMLNDIAVRKLGNHDTFGRPYDLGIRKLGSQEASPHSSPRRLRRHACPCPSDASQISHASIKYIITDEQFHEGLLKNVSLPLDEDAFNSLFSLDSDDGDRPSRPSSLDLYNPNQTPVATRKPKFNFSLAHNAYELNNLDPEILDAPNLTYTLGNDGGESTEVECGDSFPQEPASMPHIPSDNPGFSYKNPAYQSAHPCCGVDVVDSVDRRAVDENNMKKWKGVVFNADDDDDEEESEKITFENDYDILAIELNRGWNSRLGFSLQGAAGVTYVSAVHSDSVAARDGRLKPGDRIIKVNDESVENLSTNEIIDLLRIVRGPVCIVVSRTKSKQDCPQSNAEN